MKKVEFVFQPPTRIEVNGEEYEVQADDADVYERAVLIRERYAKLTKSTPPEEIVAAARDASAIVDSILGPGAMKRIAGGRAVRMRDALEIMGMILEAAAESYAEKLGEYE